MLLLTREQFEKRRADVAPGAPLAGLFDSLAAELKPLESRHLYLPAQKALFSREGGRCAHDGSPLEFDPLSPDFHRCTSCQRVHEGEFYHRHWITFYQLWLAERALHSALFWALRGNAGHAALARDILLACAERYLYYPNVDNVLGPTRPFFSTYLESIWLLQICIAADLLALDARHARVVDRVRERIVEPSRRLIFEFDERKSNRQVWNNAALLAAARLCGDRPAFLARLHGEWGLHQHLRESLLSDGTWYEGDNYHQFALRGLWYGVLLSEAAGEPLPPDLEQRFNSAFPATFAAVLPDFTVPSRKDSKYAVSLRQWWLAELAELGLARTGDPALLEPLRRCYEPGHEKRPTGRARSTADSERSLPSCLLTRDDLGWRGLLFALPVHPPLPPKAPGSVDLRAQGFAAFRRPADTYVGFEHGQSGGSHGHPDRLNLSLYQGPVRWLDDMGTGSYAERTLHWYRSTLAHSAPIAGGHSQLLNSGILKSYEEKGAFGWVRAQFTDDDARVSFLRSVVVAEDYVIDVLQVLPDAAERRVELPIHLDGLAPDLDFVDAVLDGGSKLEDGFEHVDGALKASVPARKPVTIVAERSAADGQTRALLAQLDCSHDTTLFRASGPGQPASARRAFFVVRVDPDAGKVAGCVIRTVFTWSRDVTVDTSDPKVTTLVYRTGERHEHHPDGDAWRVDLFSGGGSSSIVLDGAVEPPKEPDVSKPPEPTKLPRTKTPAPWITSLRPSDPALRYALGREHYRRSEPDWEAAGEPAADVAIQATVDRLIVFADVRAGDQKFMPPGAANPYDNEHADTMGAGLQLYLRHRKELGVWVLVPETDGWVRVRVGKDSVLPLSPPRARWRKRPRRGYEIRLELDLPTELASSAEAFDFDLIINETTKQRVRRRGQLVLSGNRNQWVYLRGEGHANTGWVRLMVE